MSRPGIVRADTIDLQDQDNPTAAEHQKHPDHDTLAPHQASQLHHVLQDRRSEEESLADAWNIAGSLVDEPSALEGPQLNGDGDHATNGTHREGGENGEGGESEGEGDDDMMDRISSSPSIEDGWGGECLREAEDIDFEFVYALHTFVATVEGQANATKGDTMVLLDDSNSYWWLVRVVKDSSIGYLPAEHIETPTERLARLNKHRNIDLSATMLSDNSEKTRNPLKKLRRRNAKTVQFAAPTYVEASDYDYSTEDEETAMGDPYGPTAAATDEPQQNGHEAEPEKAVAEGDAHGDGDGPGTPTRGSFDREQAATAAIAPSIEEPQLSPKLVDKTEAAPLKSRKGTPRNTDSFLKDDSIETRKITLTPGILREDSSTSAKSLSMDSSRSGSTENLVKQVSPPDQQISKKDGKDKKKEKVKGGMLSGLFKSKKKDKKAKDDGMESDVEKPSTEIVRSESPRLNSFQSSGTSSPVERAGHGPISGGDNRQSTLQQKSIQTPASAPAQVQAPTPASRGKLQKQPPSNSSSPVREPVKDQAKSAFFAELEGSEAAYEMGTGQEPAPAPEQQRTLDTQAAQKSKDNNGPLSPIANMLRSNSEKEPKPKKAKRSKQRIELDDFDSPEDEEGPNPFREQEERVNGGEEDTDGHDRLSESPIEIMPGTFSPGIAAHETFMHGTESIHIPTPGAEERGLQDEDEQEPESLSSPPSIIEKPIEPHEEREGEGEVPEDNDPTPTAPRSPLPAPTVGTTERNETPTRGLSTDSSDSSALLTPNAPSTPSAPAQQQPWSDSSLRAWYDDGSEIKDMLMMIHDKSDVVPVSADHPMMAGLFDEQRSSVQKMMGDLDGLLGSYLQRKGISLA